jgi:hypothetical protein
MVFVPDPPLEAGGMAGRLGPPQQASLGAHGQHVVDGLPGQRAELAADAFGDRLGGGVRMDGKPGQDGLASHRHAKPGLAQLPHHAVLPAGGSVSHVDHRSSIFLESIKNWITLRQREWGCWFWGRD